MTNGRSPVGALDTQRLLRLFQMVFKPKTGTLLEHEKLDKYSVKKFSWSFAISIQPASSVSYVPFLAMVQYGYYWTNKDPVCQET